MKHIVYELINFMGTVEYVGHSLNPLRRFKQHVYTGYGNKTGPFKGRQDIIMNLVDSYHTRSHAYKEQCRLQKEYGMITDQEKRTGPDPGKGGRTGAAWRSMWINRREELIKNISEKNRDHWNKNRDKMMTGVRNAAKSSNHISNQIRTCDICGKICKGPGYFIHKKVCK